ncbi:hypothetical protein Tco_1102307 [Tanacetum coccineum]
MNSQEVISTSAIREDSYREHASARSVTLWENLVRDYFHEDDFQLWNLSPMQENAKIKLMYVMEMYRPDVVYLCNTKDMFLVYRGDIKQELRVSCYTNVGYLTDADDLKSHTGYVFVLNGGGSLDWKNTNAKYF